jgi:hypothetical protein
MNDTYKEITKLHEQVSQLYILLKELSEYVGWQDISNLNLPVDLPSNVKVSKFSSNNVNHSHSNGLKQNRNSGDNLYLLNQHKDILMDDEPSPSSVSDSSNHSEVISCEEQVHRLTAQLTAAYYRIASLEEQLLALRNNMETGENGFYQCQ